MTLFKTERKIGAEEQLPEVLKEGIGPGAERALNLIAERRNETKQLGPGSYNFEKEGGRVKKSFNVGAQKK